jgi:riboflavin biosynthesis pyrimidine reductase
MNGMDTLLAPPVWALETLHDAGAGVEFPLPADLLAFYGPLRFALRKGVPYVIGNLVATLDGVVALGMPGRSNGKEISGFNAEDRTVMGLLRAVADAVVVGGNTLRHGPGKPRTPEDVFPPMADSYRQLRDMLGKSGPPLNVIVSASGEINPNAPIFAGEIPVLLVTTEAGARYARKIGLPGSAMIVEAEGQASGSAEHISAAEILGAITGKGATGIILVEGGPRLLGGFLGEERLDEQFLTLSPQIAGRDGVAARLGVVEGRVFAPDSPRWGTLISVKRARSHLFLRYSFSSDRSTATSTSSL